MKDAWVMLPNGGTVNKCSSLTVICCFQLHCMMRWVLSLRRVVSLVLSLLSRIIYNEYYIRFTVEILINYSLLFYWEATQIFKTYGYFHTRKCRCKPITASFLALKDKIRQKLFSTKISKSAPIQCVSMSVPLVTVDCVHVKGL